MGKKMRQGAAQIFSSCLDFRFTFIWGQGHCVTRREGLKCKGKALNISEQAADSSRVPSLLFFSHKQVQEFPKETQGPK